ncbi:MAG: MerR family transcriptional regulator [Cohnella sp.]|jgi:methanogenic corrinoid protein MtbC1|nr:MerR family transcriptional regulator [Cohnella sp.]
MNQRLFTIKETSLRTGLSTQLIRKWEERYEAVQPRRFPNGYRGYTLEDISRLAALKTRVQEGVPIGLAVQQRDSSAGSGRKPEAEEYDTLAGGSKQAGDRLLGLFLKLDYAGAQQYFDRLLAVHHIEYVLLNILEPVLVDLGERWRRGQISEYQEHFGSHFVREKLLALKNVFPVRSDDPLIVTACGPGEQHELGILFFGYFAMQQGYRVVHLGVSPSEKGIMDCLEGLRPRAFLFSFTTENLLDKATPFLLGLDERIRSKGVTTKVIVGGQIVRQDRLLPGSKNVYLLSGNARDTVEKLKRRIPVQ